jgi:hypothetical protein
MEPIKSPTSIVPIQIRHTYVTNIIKDIHLYCECGHKKKAKVIGIHNDWALWFQCTKPTCPNTWYVCNCCQDSRKKITKKEALSRHHKKQHKRLQLMVFQNPAPPSTPSSVVTPSPKASATSGCEVINNDDDQLIPSYRT